MSHTLFRLQDQANNRSLSATNKAQHRAAKTAAGVLSAVIVIAPLPSAHFCPRWGANSSLTVTQREA